MLVHLSSQITKVWKSNFIIRKILSNHMLSYKYSVHINNWYCYHIHNNSILSIPMYTNTVIIFDSNPSILVNASTIKEVTLYIIHKESFHSKTLY